MNRIYPRYPEGRMKAFTLSYDDGNDCDAILVDMMRKYGVKGTFNINSAICPAEHQPHGTHPWSRMTMEECLQVYGDDMEIAVHGANHPFWNQLPTVQAMQDILEDRRALEQATGRIIRGAASPYGKSNDDVQELLRLSGLIYCRTVRSSHSVQLTTSKDWLQLEPSCHHGDPELMTLAESFLDETKPYMQLFYVWGHSYEFMREDNWDVMETLLKTVSGKDYIWYATNIEIVEYLKAADQLITNVDCTMVRNPTDKELWVEFSPGKKIVRIPAGATVSLID